MYSRWSGYSYLGGAGGSLGTLGAAQFSNSSDLALVVGTPKVVPFTSTEYAIGGISVVDPGTGPTRLTVVNGGVYRFDLSLQLLETGGQSGFITFWPSINGTPVPNSASSVELGNNNTRSLPYVPLLLTLTAGQYVEWNVLSSNGNMSIEAFPAVVGPPAVPAIPSAIAGVLRVQ